MTINIDTKPAHEITEADLQALVTARVAEKRTIDYKAELPGKDSAAKREFLYDVTSFANSAGGLILYGIPEKGDGSGEPESVAGLECQTDSEINRLEQMLLSGVDPRIAGIEIASIPLTNDRTVIALRARRSWSRPHMVTVDGAQRFYARRLTGKYQMDVRELRAAFVGAEEQAARIRDFRLTRLASIAAGDTPAPCRPHARVVLHLVPLTLGEVGGGIDLHQIVGADGESRFPVMGAARGLDRPRWNFEGLVSSDEHDHGEPCDGYTQIFRSGAIEAMSEHPFDVHPNFRNREYPFINCRKIEKDVVASVRTFLPILRRAGAQAPFYSMLSVISVKGRVNADFLSRNRFFGRSGPPLIATEDLFLPEVLIESFDAAETNNMMARLLRPAMDVLWQATSFDRSPCWDGDEWKPDPR